MAKDPYGSDTFVLERVSEELEVVQIWRSLWTAHLIRPKSDVPGASHWRPHTVTHRTHTEQVSYTLLSLSIGFRVISSWYGQKGVIHDVQMNSYANSIMRRIFTVSVQSMNVCFSYYWIIIHPTCSVCCIYNVVNLKKYYSVRRRFSGDPEQNLVRTGNDSMSNTVCTTHIFSM